MSLNKKYTWADFLKANPEHKTKKTKRTSKEGQKAFEAACKLHNKEYLKGRLEMIDKEQERAKKNRSKLEAYAKRLESSHDRTKALQKSL